MLIVALIWILNFGISWLNARSCGMVWNETKSEGGWRRFMTWMTAIMSACGFSWCFLIVLALGAHQFFPKYMPLHATNVCLELGYLVIVPEVLFSGLMMTIDSWATAWRTRKISDMGIAGYNTFAQAYNTYEAFEGMGSALSDVFKFFSGGDKDDKDDDSSAVVMMLVVGLVVIALAGGVILTAGIIQKTAASVRGA